MDYVNKMDGRPGEGDEGRGGDGERARLRHLRVHRDGPSEDGRRKQTYWLAKDLKRLPGQGRWRTLGEAKMTTVNSDIELGASSAGLAGHAAGRRHVPGHVRDDEREGPERD